ncbi:hypothetical protein D3C78_1402560 [compost metagenome]
MLAVDLELVVQVRAGGEAGHADVADDLPLLDAGAGADALGEAAQVAVDGAVALAMLDDHGVAIATLAACLDDPAITGGLDRRAGRRGVIDALVCTDFVQDRVETPHGEA